MNFIGRFQERGGRRGAPQRRSTASSAATSTMRRSSRSAASTTSTPATGWKAAPRSSKATTARWRSSVGRTSSPAARTSAACRLRKAGSRPPKRLSADHLFLELLLLPEASASQAVGVHAGPVPFRPAARRCYGRVAARRFPRRRPVSVFPDVTVSALPSHDIPVKPRQFETRLKLLYTAIFLPLGLHLPYFPLWLAGASFSPAEIAVILSGPMFLRVATTPIILTLADRARDRVHVLTLLCAATLAISARIFPAADLWRGAGVLARARGGMAAAFAIGQFAGVVRACAASARTTRACASAARSPISPPTSSAASFSRPSAKRSSRCC